MSMSKTSLFLATFAVAFLLAKTAAAQTFHRKFELFAEGGVSMSNQFTRTNLQIVTLDPLQVGLLTTKSSLRTTGRLFTGVRLWLDHDQAIEASYSFSPTAIQFTNSCAPNCGTFKFASQRLAANFFAVNYVHTLPKAGDFRPFLTSGVGVMSLFEQEPGYIQHDPFAVNIGGGFDRRITPHWALRMESRDWLFEMPHFGPGGSGLVHNIVPSLGPVFRF